jgi:CubicO group peptidase (beta-lactamase class C family)
MKIHRINALLNILLFVVLLSSSAAAQVAPLEGFDDYVNKAIKDWEIPGIAIAIVKDDKVVLAKGYGLRELGKAAPVDERTRKGDDRARSPLSSQWNGARRPDVVRLGLQP